MTIRLPNELGKKDGEVVTRATIDFGIDLGTTNSSIAVAHAGGIEIIKNQGRELTPSMVYIDKKGRVFRGFAARQHLYQASRAASVQKEFKRLMGQQVQLDFAGSDVTMSPEELSAEVLKSLREAASERFGSPPSSVVITVPAMFEIPQNQATVNAAELAGFEHVVLLQEPVAAASAYGFQTDSDKAYWIVYDLGGGTFDASIVSVRDGQLTVVSNKGDNYLGGADFDKAVMEEVVLPSLKEKYDLAGLSFLPDLPVKERGRLAKLTVLAEQLKIELSRHDSDELFEEDVFDDDSGEPVDVDCSLSRKKLEEIIDVSVSRTIKLTKELIAESGLKVADFEKLLLVGGCTFIPKVREKVGELGIPLELAMDPMTVVAYGAAVFASGQRIPSEFRQVAPVAAGAASIELEYEPLGKEITPLVMGKVLVDGQPAPSGTTVVIERMDEGKQGYASGDLAIDAKSIFRTNVRVHEKGQSQFVIKVKDASGVTMDCSPDQFAITNGMSVSKTTLTQGIGLALADGTTTILAPPGVSLPYTSDTFKAVFVRELKQGSDDCLSIPITCGSEPLAEHNCIGTVFELFGHKVDQDVPAGSMVEAVANVSANQTGLISLHIPVLDETYEVTTDVKLEHETPEVMRGRLSRIETNLDELEEKAEKAGDDEAVREIRAVRGSDSFVVIRKSLDAWDQGDKVAAGQARNRLVDASKEVDAMASNVDWPASVEDYRERVSDTRKAVHEYGDADERKMLEAVTSEGDQAIAAEDPAMLKRAHDQMMQLGLAMRAKDPAWWAGLFTCLVEQEDKYPSQGAARNLFEEGTLAMRRGDVESLKSVCHQLRDMLPMEVAAAAEESFSSIMAR